MEVYDIKRRNWTYPRLSKNVKVKAGKKDGIITISVIDKDPQRAAAIANAYVEELDKVLTRVSISSALQNRVFLEERLVKAKKDLVKAEDDLKLFQSKYKAVDIIEQAKGTIKGVAELEGQLALEEVKLAGLGQTFTESSQEFRSQQSVIRNLKAQIAKFEGIRNATAVPGVGSVPEIGQQYLRLMREFKIQESIVELLTKQHEISQLTEARDFAAVQVLQKARVPDFKTTPIRWRIVLLGTLFSGFIGIFWAFAIEAAARMPDEEKERWRRLRALLPDLPRLNVRSQ
jgi:uncharacterized protein involved in exopolysaccharide biosynthesis